MKPTYTELLNGLRKAVEVMKDERIDEAMAGEFEIFTDLLEGTTVARTGRIENLVRIIAGFKKQGEDEYDYVKDDDAIATVDWIIDEAREVLGDG